MKRGISRLILVLALATGGAVAEQTAVAQGQGDEPWIFSGPMRGAYIGVRTQDVSKDRVAQLKLREETGVEITMVDRDAPAGKAGIKEHDVILTFNGSKVDSEEQLRRMVRETPVGRTVTLGISRDGQMVSVPVTLASRKEMMKAYAKAHPQDFEGMPDMSMPPMPPMPPMTDIDVPNIVVQSTSRSGINVESVTPQLAEFFGVKGGGGGVLVRSVEKGSVAESSGLRAGDVIIKADQERISDMGDWRRVLRTKSGQIVLTVMRDKREQTVNIKLPERRRTGSLMGGAFDININAEEIQREIEKARPQMQIVAKEMAAQREEIRKAIELSREEVQRAVDRIVVEWDEE